jgi:hypothetical protein
MPFSSSALAKAGLKWAHLEFVSAVLIIKDKRF